MNVEIWTEATQFPEQEYINSIFIAVRMKGTIENIEPKPLHLKLTLSQSENLKDNWDKQGILPMRRKLKMVPKTA